MLRLGGLAVLFGFACGAPDSAPAQEPPFFRVDRLRCELSKLSIDDQADAQQWAHFMVSGAFRIAHSADPEVRSHWEPGVGLSLQTRGAPRSVVLSASLSLSEKGFDDLQRPSGLSG